MSDSATLQPPRAHILGCDIDRLGMVATVGVCREALRERRYTQHVAINAAKLVAFQSDAELQRIIRECQLVTADGQAVVWASRLLDDPLPMRIAGIDLMWQLFALAEQESYRIFILGARDEVLAAALKRIRKAHPRLIVAGTMNGYFDPEDSAAVAERIASTRPDMLFVAISSPRKEEFLGQFGPSIGAPLVMGVGGSIDVAAGIVRRAPQWMQTYGLEWLFRLIQEPRRMLPRYARSNVQFIRLVVTEWMRQRRVR